MAAGGSLRKYGQIIGFARCPMAPGEHVHSHNLEHGDFASDYAAGSEARDTAYVADALRATFMGYRRPGGRAGTRNYIGVLSTVNCSATVVRHVAMRYGGDALAAYPHVDGVVAITHGTGCDPVSITGMVAGGANMLCFTTGRGSVFGCKPVPCLKLATNSAMYHRMSGDMDINCGLVIDGEAGIEAMGGQIFRLVLNTASGAPSKSEALGFGDDEFIPWQIGAVM